MAQEVPAEDKWDLSNAPMVWKAEKKKLVFGELELTVWILPTHGMTAPIGGYLLYRGDTRRTSDHNEHWVLFLW